MIGKAGSTVIPGLVCKAGLLPLKRRLLVKRLVVFAIFSVTQSFQVFAPFRPLNGPAHVYRPVSWPRQASLLA
jgi:hypothetical protein